MPIIVKSGDDLRQEQLATQLVKAFARIFADAKVPVRLRPYEVLATSEDAGVIEAVPDTISLDGLRSNYPQYSSLKAFFLQHFGARGFKRARRNFCDSLAGYAVVCYLLQIKDRHNGNLLVDDQGPVIHIDFGFLLGISVWPSGHSSR